MTDRSVPTLTASRETAAATYNGLAILGVAAFGPALILGGMAADVPLLLIPGALLLVFLAPGFYMIQPNQAAAILLFGAYRGTDRAEGLRWVWPWMTRKRISVRANNLISQQIKVNDLRGNPIEMAAQVVWRVTDTAQALFDVDDYRAFVVAQIEAAIRAIGARYPYDDFEHQEVTLRGNHDQVGGELRIELMNRLAVAGITVDECGFTHLAYAPEIAGAMLRRQQAEAAGRRRGRHGRNGARQARRKGGRHPRRGAQGHHGLQPDGRPLRRAERPARAQHRHPLSIAVPEARKSLLLRLPPELHAALERQAAADLRSVNAQIEILLREALTRRGIKLAQAEPPRRGRPRKGEPT